MNLKKPALLTLSSLLLIACTPINEDSGAITEPAVDEYNLTEHLDLNNKRPGTNFYHSEALGIAFSFFVDDTYVEISEAGNRITVGEQFVDVYEKDPTESLNEAIERQFLDGYDPEKCFVEMRESNIEGYQKAIISYPPPNYGVIPDAESWFNAKDCPGDHTPTYKYRYFLSSEEHPDMLIFVDMSGDTFQATPETRGRAPFPPCLMAASAIVSPDGISRYAL